MEGQGRAPIDDGGDHAEELLVPPESEDSEADAEAAKPPVTKRSERGWNGAGEAKATATAFGGPQNTSRDDGGATSSIPSTETIQNDNTLLLAKENEVLKEQIVRMQRELENLRQRRIINDDSGDSPRNDDVPGVPAAATATVVPQHMARETMGTRLGNALGKLPIIGSGGNGGNDKHRSPRYESLSVESPEQELRTMHHRRRHNDLDVVEAGRAHDHHDEDRGGSGRINGSSGSGSGSSKTAKAKLSDEEMDANDNDNDNSSSNNERESFVHHGTSPDCASATAVGGTHQRDRDLGNGVDGDTPFRDVVKDRASWLVGLLVLQSCSSFILARNEALLESHLVIVQFLTMLVGAGGNAGNQASVRVIRGLAVGTLNERTVRAFLWTEAKMGVALSAILGLAGLIRASVFMVPVAETVAITTSLYMIVISSVCIGAVLPLAMNRCGLDPAHSSTTIQVLMDILGVSTTVWVSGAILNTSVGPALTAMFHDGSAAVGEGDYAAEAATDDMLSGAE